MIVTARNVQLVKNTAGFSPWNYSHFKVKSGLFLEFWRPSLLLKYLDKLKNYENVLLNTDRLTQIINYLFDTGVEVATG